MECAASFQHAQNAAPIFVSHFPFYLICISKHIDLGGITVLMGTQKNRRKEIPVFF